MIVASAHHHVSNTGGLIVLWIFLVVFYWVPTIVAWVRKVPNAMSVTVINFFAFLFFIPWIVALAMACRSGRTSHSSQ